MKALLGGIRRISMAGSSHSAGGGRRWSLGWAFRGLVVLMLLGGAALCGCAPKLLGERYLVPDPLWVLSGLELRDDVMSASSGGSMVEAKYLNKADLADLLGSRSRDPALFHPPPAWFDSSFVFLLSVTNSSSSPLMVEGRYASLLDNRRGELLSLAFPEIYQMTSAEKAAEERMRALEGLLFSPTPLVGGESRQGLLFFGLPDERATKVTLTIPFIHVDKDLQKWQVSFPFEIRVIPPEGEVPEKSGHEK